jgi:ribosome-interacting GTPase 1
VVMCVARRGVGRGKWEKRFRLGESRGQRSMSELIGIPHVLRSSLMSSSSQHTNYYNTYYYTMLTVYMLPASLHAMAV